MEDSQQNLNQQKKKSNLYREEVPPQQGLTQNRNSQHSQQDLVQKTEDDLHQDLHQNLQQNLILDSQQDLNQTKTTIYSDKSCPPGISAGRRGLNRMGISDSLTNSLSHTADCLPGQASESESDRDKGVKRPSELLN